MRRLRTLSLARKLAVPSLCTLALLAVLSWLALGMVPHLGALRGEEVAALEMLLTSVLAALLAVSCLATARAHTWRFRVLVETVQRLAAGETGIAIPFQDRQDEVGHVAKALETLRGAAARAFVQAQIAEQTPTPLLTVAPGADARITYANPAARELLVDGAVGRPLRELVPVPPNIAAGLADPQRLPVQERICLNEEVLEVFASGVLGQNGQAAGALIVLRRRTQQAALAARFEREVGAVVLGLSQAAEEMRRTAEAMDRTAAETGGLATNMAGASEQASGNVAQVAATAEELAASVAEIARQVAEGARITSEASSEASATDARVGELSDAASHIGSVVRLIGDIAARTNLLALNATIEAARAGDAGRGFAVVAGEVKTLASQTAKATQDIAGQIAAMQARTSEAVGALRGITETIARLNGVSAAIAGAVEQQGAATREIARAVQQAAFGTRGVTAALADVTHAVDQTRAQAATVLSSAADLTGRSSNLRAETEGFLAAIHAA